MLEHDHANGLAVGTTCSTSLVSRENGTHGTDTAVNTVQYAETGTHGTDTAVNTVQYAETGKLQTPSVLFVIHSSNEQTEQDFTEMIQHTRKGVVCQFGYLQILHQDARSTEHKMGMEVTRARNLHIKIRPYFAFTVSYLSRTHTYNLYNHSYRLY